MHDFLGQICIPGRELLRMAIADAPWMPKESNLLSTGRAKSDAGRANNPPLTSLGVMRRLRTYLEYSQLLRFAQLLAACYLLRGIVWCST